MHERKRVVGFILPPVLMPVMFRDQDLAELRAQADVVGPFHAEDVFGLRDALARADAIITCWGSPKFDDVLLSAAPNLKLIAHSAGTVKPIVTDAVYDRGIHVTTSAAANATVVAEFTVAMMQMMLKRVPWAATAYARGDRDARNPLLKELRDVSVGLVSASRVGREVIRLLKSYQRLRVKVFDPQLNESDAKELGVESVSLEEVCGCEVVSIHAPSIPETHHMFNAHTLALLPDNGILINTSRGSVIDEAALVAEVRARPIFVLLDVTDPEPPLPDSPLRTEPNIILTPHIAGSLAAGKFDMGRLAIDEVLRFLRGEKLQHEVTREMLPTQA